MHCQRGTPRVLLIFDDPTDVPPVHFYDHNMYKGFASCRNFVSNRDRVRPEALACVPRTRLKRPNPVAMQTIQGHRARKRLQEH